MCGCTKWEMQYVRDNSSNSSNNKQNENRKREKWIQQFNLCLKIILLFAVEWRHFFYRPFVCGTAATSQIPSIVKMLMFSVYFFNNNSFQTIFMNFLRWPNTFLFIRFFQFWFVNLLRIKKEEENEMKNYWTKITKMTSFVQNNFEKHWKQ